MSETRTLELRPGDMVFALYEREGFSHPPTGARCVLSYQVGDMPIPNVLSAFADWMRGCGYVFEGHLAIVDDDDEYGDA